MGPTNLAEGISGHGVQILSSEEIAIMIMNEPKLRNNMIEVAKLLVNNISQLPNHSNEGKTQYMRMLHLGYDLKYMSKPLAMQAIVHKCDFIDKWLDVFYSFYFHDVIEQSTEMEEYESENVK